MEKLLPPQITFNDLDNRNNSYAQNRLHRYKK